VHSFIHNPTEVIQQPDDNSGEDSKRMMYHIESVNNDGHKNTQTFTNCLFVEISPKEASRVDVVEESEKKGNVSPSWK